MTPAATSRTPPWRAILAVAAAFTILVGLGVWQLQRLGWKDSLLARIDAAERLPPAPLADETPPQFTRVVAEGTLRPALALVGADVRGVRMGAQAVQLLDRPGHKPLVVELGWVPTDPAAPPAQAGPARITGYVRLPVSGGLLAAADDPARRRFFTLDPAKIGAALGARDAAPFTLVALGSPASPSAPQPATELPRPVNNHLQYALTWFALAAVLLVMSFQRLRSGTAAPGRLRSP